MKDIIVEVIAALLQTAMPIVIIFLAIWISAFYADDHIAEVLTISILAGLASVGISEYMYEKIEAKKN